MMIPSATISKSTVTKMKSSAGLRICQPAGRFEPKFHRCIDARSLLRSAVVHHRAAIDGERERRKRFGSIARAPATHERVFEQAQPIVDAVQEIAVVFVVKREPIRFKEQAGFACGIPIE